MTGQARRMQATRWTAATAVATCSGSLSPQMFEDTIKDVLAIRRVLGHEPA